MYKHYFYDKVNVLIITWPHFEASQRRNGQYVQQTIKNYVVYFKIPAFILGVVCNIATYRYIATAWSTTYEKPKTKEKQLKKLCLTIF